MPTDVERLRVLADELDDRGLHEAADEIEKLRADLRIARDDVNRNADALEREEKESGEIRTTLRAQIETLKAEIDRLKSAPTVTISPALPSSQAAIADLPPLVMPSPPPMAAHMTAEEYKLTKYRAAALAGLIARDSGTSRGVSGEDAEMYAARAERVARAMLAAEGGSR